MIPSKKNDTKTFGNACAINRAKCGIDLLSPWEQEVQYFCFLLVQLHSSGHQNEVLPQLHEVRKKLQTQDRYHFASKGIIPSEAQLFLLWNGSLTTIPRDTKRFKLENVPTMSDKPESWKAASSANAVLTPSPGETFWLDIHSLDQVLNKAQTALFVEVLHLLTNYVKFPWVVILELNFCRQRFWQFVFPRVNWTSLKPIKTFRRVNSVIKETKQHRENFSIL